MNADVLSRCPADTVSSHSASPTEENKICVVETKEFVSDLEEVAKCQKEDSDMSTMIAYLQDSTLPEDQSKSRQIACARKQAV